MTEEDPAINLPRGGTRPDTLVDLGETMFLSDATIPSN